MDDDEDVLEQWDLDGVEQTEEEGEEEQCVEDFVLTDHNVEPSVTVVTPFGARSCAGQTVAGREWHAMLTHAFATTTNFHEQLQYPWEQDIYKQIFSENTGVPSSLISCGDSTDVRSLRTMVAGSSGLEHRSESEPAALPAYKFAVRSLKDVDYLEDKRCKMALACSTWLEILSIHWDSSSVGQQLKLDLQQDQTGDLALQSLKAVFGVKSACTVLKRASSVKQYIVWFQKRCIEEDIYVTPFPFKEQDVWSYFGYLKAQRSQRGKGFTVSSTFLETMRFCKFLLGFWSCDEIISSKRLAGFAALERKEKGPLVQAPPLELEHLFRLHSILSSGCNNIDRIAAGIFLCCIYARARWSDFRFVHHFKYDGYKRNATFDIYTSEHKTSSTGLRREQFMPFIVPTEGVCEGDWLGILLQLLKDQGFDLEKVPYGPMLPAPKSETDWCARPLSTNEAACWLRKLLEGCPNAGNVRAHSMKVTLCVWAARAGLSKDHRATLSHHATAVHGSDIVYSRDLQSGAIRKLQSLLKRIRLGKDSSSKEAEKNVELTATFDSGHHSVVRTPNLNVTAPVTPCGPEVSQPSCGVVEANGDVVKDDIDLETQCLQEVPKIEDDFVLMPWSGLVQIDSSSGSESDLSGDSSDSGSSAEHFANSLPENVYTETVPATLDYYFHKKSKIMHKSRVGGNIFHCKTRANNNFILLQRTFHFKYPRCMRCFHDDHNRITSAEKAVSFFDRASKRAKNS